MEHLFSYLPIILIGGLIWFFIWRSQRKRKVQAAGSPTTLSVQAPATRAKNRIPLFAKVAGGAVAVVVVVNVIAVIMEPGRQSLGDCIVGRWQYTWSDGDVTTLEYRSDGTYSSRTPYSDGSYSSDSGRYEVSGEVLRHHGMWVSGSYSGASEESFHVTCDSSSLILDDDGVTFRDGVTVDGPFFTYRYIRQ